MEERHPNKSSTWEDYEKWHENSWEERKRLSNDERKEWNNKHCEETYRWVQWKNEKREEYRQANPLIDCDPEELFEYNDWYAYPIMEEKDGKQYLKDFSLEKYEDSNGELTIKHLIQDEKWESYYVDTPYKLNEIEQMEHDAILELNDEATMEQKFEERGSDAPKLLQQAVYEELKNIDRRIEEIKKGNRPEQKKPKAIKKEDVL